MAQRLCCTTPAAPITSSLSNQVGVYAHEHEDLQTDNFMKVYSPTQGDECYIALDSDGNIDAVKGPWLIQNNALSKNKRTSSNGVVANFAIC